MFDISEILVRWVYEMFGSQGSLNEAYSHFCNLVNWDPPHTQAHRFINRVSDFIDFFGETACSNQTGNLYNLQSLFHVFENETCHLNLAVLIKVTVEVGRTKEVDIIHVRVKGQSHIKFISEHCYSKRFRLRPPLQTSV